MGLNINLIKPYSIIPKIKLIIEKKCTFYNRCDVNTRITISIEKSMSFNVAAIRGYKSNSNQ